MEVRRGTSGWSPISAVPQRDADYLRKSRWTRGQPRVSARCRAPVAAPRWTRTDRSGHDRLRSGRPVTVRCEANARVEPSRPCRGPWVPVSAPAGAAAPSGAPGPALTRLPRAHFVSWPRDRLAWAAPAVAQPAALSPPPPAGVGGRHLRTGSPSRAREGATRRARRRLRRSPPAATSGPGVRRKSDEACGRAVHPASVWCSGGPRSPETRRPAQMRSPYGAAIPRISAMATVPTTCMLSTLTLSAVSSRVWWYG